MLSRWTSNSRGLRDLATGTPADGRLRRLTLSTSLKILGTGMLASAMAAHGDAIHDTVVFARGVSDSSMADATAYQREAAFLDATIRSALEAHERLVYFSSGGSVYGPITDVRDETTPLRPTTDYGRHKVAMEERIRASGVRHLIVRLPNLVGPRQNGAQLVPSLVQQALRGRVTLQRLASRDLLDVDDAASLVARLLRVGRDNEVIVVASGISTPVTEILAYIATILDVRPSIALLDVGEPQRFDNRAMLTRLGMTLDELQVRSVEQALLRHVPSLAGSGRQLLDR